MNRGDVVIGSDRGELQTKRRPYVIVQQQSSIVYSTTLTVVPITTVLIGRSPIRLPITRTVENGLDEDSELDVARVTTIRKRGVRQTVGRADPDLMTAVDAALRLWLDL